MLIGAFVFFIIVLTGIAFCENTQIGRKISNWFLINVFGFTAEELED